MSAGYDMRVTMDRVVMAVLGGCAGLALWALGRIWDMGVMPPLLYLAIFAFVAIYGSVALALAGPVPPGRALVGALVLAVPATMLVALAGMRHGVATDLLGDPVMLGVTGVLVLFATPFLSVWLCHRDNWLSYAALFETAWTIVIRFLAAWIFVAGVLLVAFLSDALLQLVGIDAIERLMRREWVMFTLGGTVLGLALAVVYELRETISPFLILRLLRLLVPVQLAVVGVFLVALPLRGLSELFGEFSSAATLMGAAILAVILISSALERNDAEAVRAPLLRGLAQVMTTLVPVLAALSVWAVALRVRQYAWTPDRLLAACVGLILLAYGLGYAGSVLRGRGWAGRIRRVNVAMALAVIGGSALWLTPALNAYRISADSQVARYTAGTADAFDLPLWEMAHRWGRAGQAGLDRLAQASGGDTGPASLAARIALVRETTSRYRYNLDLDQVRAPQIAAELAHLISVRPEGALTLSAADLADLPLYRLTDWIEGCKRLLPDGRTGCVLVAGGFSPAAPPERQGMLLFPDGRGGTRANHVMRQPDGSILVREVFDPLQGTWPSLPEDAVRMALDGAFSVRPSGAQALFLGDSVLVPGN